MLLGELEGSHDVLVVEAAALEEGDVLVKGQCLRSLSVLRWKDRCGYAVWTVADMAGKKRGDWEFLHGARHLVLRKKESYADKVWGHVG